MNALEFIKNKDEIFGQGWSEVSDDLAEALENYSDYKNLVFISALTDLVESVEKLNLKYVGTHENTVLNKLQEAKEILKIKR